ncbi:MAG: aldehyde dehydrogenase family protein [Acidobacteriota bacterium]|nr:aldehyde dehydrogenase family protein [Blastocatellia bacterium]MDW8411170.1 aldehyde dehydrogenase family protein [Acidobacteriota bacterium]
MERPILVAGAWSREGEQLERRSEFTGEVTRTYLASRQQVEDAISAAAASAEAFAKLPSYKRARILANVAEELLHRSEDFAALIVSEVGKPLKAARVEVARAAQTFTLAAEEAKRLSGDLLPLDLEPASEGRLALVRRFAIGPVTAITPFNFPLNLIAHKVAPAGAVGNPVLIKPAPQAPLVALALAEVLLKAGWPAAALSVLPCSNEVATLLVTDKRVKMLSFTGSAAVGWRLKQLAAEKRVVLELGGNAAVIVHSDAELDAAAQRCAAGAFAYSGQICISVQRVYVHRPVYEQFLECLLAATAGLKLGDPRDETTDIGPMISEAEAIRAETWIKEAVEQGAKVLCGARRQKSFIEPTVLVNVAPQLRINTCEAFAPVVTVAPYDDFDEALQLVDDSPYGLQAGLFTKDIGNIFKAYENLHVGGLVVGDIPTYRAEHMPYGGVKQSGTGREGIRYAIEEMTELKTLVLKL